MSHHIEGMGMLGSLLALRLEELEIDFTWNDLPSDHQVPTAWRASTGLVYPEGSPDAMRSLKMWESRLGSMDHLEQVHYSFTHRNPPAGGTYPVQHDLGWIRVAEPLALSVDVQSLVQETRRRFSDRETPHRGEDQTLLVAHTTPERGDGYLWGWSATAELQMPMDLDLLETDLRFAIYAKKHRFHTAYVYPLPGEPSRYWIGTDIKFQRIARERSEAEMERVVDTWLQEAEEILGVTDVRVDSVYQGWRPRARPEDSGRPEYDEEIDRWTLPAMAASGVRKGPLVVEDLISRLGVDIL